MSETFPLIPPAAKPLWALGAIGLLLVALLILFGYIAFASRSGRVEISSEGLHIRGPLYGRMIPAAALVADGARAMDLGQAKEYRPRWRTNGVGLPGYSAGWFKLRNGEKALLFVTDPNRVVYIPTRQGYSVLLSVAEPQTFLRSLARVSGSGPA